MNHCKQRDETLFSEALDSLISQGTDFCVSYGLGKPNIKNLRATVTTAQNSGIVPLTNDCYCSFYLSNSISIAYFNNVTYAKHDGTSVR